MLIMQIESKLGIGIDVIQQFMLTSETEKRKAGLWQSDELFKDYFMNIVRNLSIEIKNIPKDFRHIQNYVKPDLPWAEDHFQERISGDPTNPGETYKYWPYNQQSYQGTSFMDDKLFSHTYQERFWPKKANENNKPMASPLVGIRYEYGDLSDVIEQLYSNPLTRQAYLPIFFPEDTGAVHKQRVPCTLGYLFEIWNNKLEVTYYIRSCDSFRHFRNDIYFTIRLQMYIANLLAIKGLNIKLGNIIMHIANLHLFQNDKYSFNKKERRLWKTD